LGYPGFSDPLIKLVTKLDPSQLLDHDSVVQFSSLEGNIVPSLPEKYNGLGYQNLISIIFKLISFRDDWMQVGVSKRKDNLDSIEPIQPIHLVLLEEPEAHLHVQVQQVFIKKAYDVLRNHDSLHNKNEFTTQMIISTHSSALAKDSDFLDLRYFRRLIDNKSKIPYSEILNLSKIFKSGVIPSSL
jgi:predicted ATP-dependent endonuclease of OLD family